MGLQTCCCWCWCWCWPHPAMAAACCYAAAPPTAFLADGMVAAAAATTPNLISTAAATAGLDLPPEFAGCPSLPPTWISVGAVMLAAASASRSGTGTPSCWKVPGSCFLGGLSASLLLLLRRPALACTSTCLWTGLGPTRDTWRGGRLVRAA
jgi:hypothetical protein